MSAFTERAVLFGDRSPLVGVLTLPHAAESTVASQAPPKPAVVLLNAGIVHHVGPNRLHTRLARGLARQGYAVLRFDLSGIGDSPRRAQPLAEAIADDVAAAFALLSETLGVSQLVTFGLCAGADNALMAAHRDPRVCGAVLLDPSIWRTPGWYRRQALNPKTLRKVLTGRHPRQRQLLSQIRGRLKRDPAPAPPSPEHFRTGYLSAQMMRESLEVVIGRTQLMWIFTGGWADIYNHKRQLFEVFPDVDFDPTMRLEHRPAADHTFTDPAESEWLIAAVTHFLSGLPTDR